MLQPAYVFVVPLGLGYRLFITSLLIIFLLFRRNKRVNMWRENNQQACRDVFRHASSGHFMSYTFLSSGHHIYTTALWAPKATAAAAGGKCAAQLRTRQTVQRLYININVHV